MSRFPDQCRDLVAAIHAYDVSALLSKNMTGITREPPNLVKVGSESLDFAARRRNEDRPIHEPPARTDPPLGNQ
jgi:hypothetical protein